MIDKKMKILLKSHKILEYGEDLKREADRLKDRRRFLERKRIKEGIDGSEVVFIDCELEVIQGLMDKIGEMMEDEFKKI